MSKTPTIREQIDTELEKLTETNQGECVTSKYITDELDRYAIPAWISDGDGKQHTEMVVQLKIAESVLESLISQSVIEGKINELQDLEADMISSDSQWFAIGERIETLKKEIR